MHRHYAKKHPDVEIPKTKIESTNEINWEKKLTKKEKNTNKNKILPRKTFKQRKKCVEIAKKK